MPPPGDGWEKLRQLSIEEQALVKKSDEMMLEWEKVSEELATALLAGGERQ